MLTGESTTNTYVTRSKIKALTIQCRNQFRGSKNKIKERGKSGQGKAAENIQAAGYPNFDRKNIADDGRKTRDLPTGG